MSKNIEDDQKDELPQLLYDVKYDRITPSNARTKLLQIVREARIDELQPYADIVENAPADRMDWLDEIIHEHDTLLTHAHQSMFAEVQINEGTAANKKAKASFAQHFKNRITALKKAGKP